MKKSLLLKFGLAIFSLGLFCPFFTSAAIKFNLTGLQQIYALSKEKMADNMMYVHFADNGNDYGGFLYFSDGIGAVNDVNPENEEKYIVNTNSSDSQIYECRSKVRGFYYNAERGERLWPLDDETWKGLTGLAGLETTGGIYTVCAQSGYAEAMKECENNSGQNYIDCAYEARLKFQADGYGYYGNLEQTYSGQKYNLTIGVEYNTDTDKFIPIKSGSKLATTFVRLNNKYPVGFIYDTMGGIGLAGCKCEDPGSQTMQSLVEAVQSGGLASVFSVEGTGVAYRSGSVSGVTLNCNNISFEDTLLKIVIEGIMGLSDGGVEGDTKFGTIGNSSDTKMQYFGTKSVSNTTMMNHARRKAGLLCRGKWLEFFPENLNNSDKIICLNNDVGKEEAENVKNKGKTLIVKNGNVTISPMSGDDDKYHDIFILSGDLLVDETESKFVIDDKGFITGMNLNDFNLNAILSSNGIENKNEASARLSGCIAGINSCLEYEDGNCLWSDVDSCKLWMDLNRDGSITTGDLSLIQNYNGSISSVSSVASAIKGNFVVNGNIKSASGDVLRNKYFIYGKFTTKDTFNSLENVFVWRCNSEMGSDSYPCPKTGPYRNAALVVIDQNYPSTLFDS